MVLMAGFDLPVRAIRQQVSSALDLIVHLERLEDGSRRVTHDHRGAADGVGRDHAAGPLRVQDRLDRGRPHDHRRRSARPACARCSCTSSRSTASSCRPTSSRAAAVAALARSREAAGDREANYGRSQRSSPPRSSPPRSRRPAAAAASASGVQIAQAPARTSRTGRTSLVAAERPAAHAPAGARSPRTASPVQRRHRREPGAEKQSAPCSLIDASNSMEGKPIAEAMAAARAFAARRNPGQPLAVVTFNDDVTVAAAAHERPGVDRRGAREDARRSPTGTHIYDALEQAAAAAPGRAASRAARSCSSPTARTSAARSTRRPRSSAVKDAKARVFAVGLRLGASSTRTRSSDRRRADRRAPTARRRAPRRCSRSTSELGFTLANEYLLRYRSLAGPDAKIIVAVTVDGIPGAATASYTTPALASRRRRRQAVAAGIGSSGRRSR